MWIKTPQYVPDDLRDGTRMIGQLGDLNLTKFVVAEAHSSWLIGHRLGVWAALAVYIVTAAYTRSMLIAIIGGVVVVALRLAAIERLHHERLVLLGDLIVSCHKHSDALIREVVETLPTREQRSL